MEYYNKSAIFSQTCAPIYPFIKSGMEIIDFSLPLFSFGDVPHETRLVSIDPYWDAG